VIDAASDVVATSAAATWSGDLAILGGDPAAAAPLYAASLELAERDGDWIQVINDGTLAATSLLQAGVLLPGLEAAGAADALASDAGHGGLAYNSAFRVAETMADARAAAGEAGAAAYARGRALPPAERVPRILALAQGIDLLTNRE
jgi:hypothetical protein